MDDFPRDPDSVHPNPFLRAVVPAGGERLLAHRARGVSLSGGGDGDIYVLLVTSTSDPHRTSSRGTTISETMGPSCSRVNVVVKVSSDDAAAGIEIRQGDPGHFVEVELAVLGAAVGGGVGDALVGAEVPVQVRCFRGAPCVCACEPACAGRALGWLGFVEGG